jgi:hypothetical protein
MIEIVFMGLYSHIPQILTDTTVFSLRNCWNTSHRAPSAPQGPDSKALFESLPYPLQRWAFLLLLLLQKHAPAPQASLQDFL